MTDDETPEMWAALWAALPADVRTELKADLGAPLSDRASAILKATALQLRPPPQPLVNANEAGLPSISMLAAGFVDWISIQR